VTGLLAVVLFVHGLAHLVGFAGPWRLIDVEGVTFQKALFDGRVPVGDRTMRALGVVWLGLALGFFASAGAAALGLAWWPGTAAALAIASLLMCAAHWPAARIGALVNVVLLMVLFVARRSLWI
jgi:hypothetical protein